MILELAAFLQLAASCAPSVAPETLAAVARAESGFDPHAINLNGPGGGRQRVGTREEAIALATELVVVRRRSVDLGLMQVNSANLPRLGLSIADAFDPCRSLAAGAHILAEGYTAAAGAGEPDPQRALRVALSRYNTGHPERGFANGYVAGVERAAERVVPAIRLRGDPPVAVAPGPEGAAAAAPVRTTAAGPPPPPAWDVFGQARQARQFVYGPPPAARDAQPSAPAATPTTDAPTRTAAR